MARTIGPRPRMSVVIQHAGHDVLFERGVVAVVLASFVVVVGHVQSVREVKIANDDQNNRKSHFFFCSFRSAQLLLAKLTVYLN